MAKDRVKENQIRALWEARLKSSRGGGESRPAAQHGVDTAGVRVPKAQADVSGLRSKAGVASGPREAKSSSDAARTATPRKPKPAPPQSPKASAAASETTTHQYREPEKRKAYMADYMRKRRRRQAEQRAKVKQ